MAWGHANNNLVNSLTIKDCTINKIVEDKNATITVNVKSLLGGKYETADDTLGNSTSGGTIKQVQVKITVDDDTVYDEKVDPTTTNLMQPISGKGTVKVKVYVDWDSKEIYGSVDAAMSRLKEEYSFEQFISEEISPLELLRMTEEEAYERYYDYMMDEVNRIYYCIEVDIP